MMLRGFEVIRQKENEQPRTLTTKWLKWEIRGKISNLTQGPRTRAKTIKE